ncbi:MAG TPA: ATP-binding protein [Streptosporangiaceae bacterium]
MAASAGIGNGSAALWYRVHAVSADSVGGTAAADYAAVLPAALNAARHRRSFIVGWLSRGGGAPLELITNAGPLSPAGHPAVAEDADLAGDASPGRDDATDSAAEPGDHSGSDAAAEVEMLFPWGARGSVIGANMITELDRLVWAACPGRLVPVSPDAPARPGPAEDGRPPTLFESALQTLMGRPFGWLVVADPTDLIEDETAELRSQLTVLRRYEDEQARFEAARGEQRLAELDAYREAGLWHVRVLVGAATEQDLALIAPVLVGSADLGAHPYRLRCPDGAQEFADALAARLTDPADGSAVPFAATAGALAAVTGLPRHEVPGVRLMRAGYFDVTADERAREPGIELGRILDARDREVGAFSVPLTTLNRHALVTGATGSGKSQTIRHLLEQLTSAGIGWLTIEPVKSEYGVMAARLASTGGERRRGSEVTLINPADPESVPLSVNPLAPEPGYPVQGHIDMVRALFLAAFEAREPFPQIMAQALQRVYEECGWDPLTGAGRADQDAPPAVPTLAGLQAAALAVIEDVGYGRELQADMRGFIDVRLRSLRTGSAGRFFEGGHPADIDALLDRNVVLALEDVANDEDKAFVIGALLIRIVEHLRLRARSESVEGLRHVIVLEEAHRLLRAGREGASAHAVELFAGLLAEIRAYGEGIVVAEQIPAKLVPDVVKNTALKVLHRLPAADDRQLVGAAMNLDEPQSRHVVSLPPGEAVAFTDGMDRPMRIRVPFGGNRERRRGGQPEITDSGATGLRGTDSSLLVGRRSAGCGQACRGVRPCTLVEVRAADLVARSVRDAWLRVWSEAYVLAHLVNRPRPRVPVPLRTRWAQLPERLRECALATALDEAVQRRSAVLRSSYDPAALTAACAASAAGMLDGGKGAGTMPGITWVIPQLQWLHELERVCPLDGPPPDPFGQAPPLDYSLPGLAGEDVKIGQRISGLRRHPLSMEVTGNRLVAWTALLGGDDHQGFIDDLAAVAIGVSHRGQLRKAAGEMGVTGWLEAVLSWPRRFIVGTDDQAPLPAPEGDPVAG